MRGVHVAVVLLVIFPADQAQLFQDLWDPAVNVGVRAVIRRLVKDDEGKLSIVPLIETMLKRCQRGEAC